MLKRLALAAFSAASLLAFGATAELSHVLFVYLVATVAGAFCPTPSGVGAFEATMVLLFIKVGVDPGSAICASLTYRSLTFWLPMVPALRASQRMRAMGAL